MPSFSQLPGELGISFIAGDEVSVSVDFDRDITGFEIEAPIYVTNVFATGLGGSGSAVSVGDTVATWTVSVVDAAAGVIALGLTEAQTSALTAGVGYRWYLRWVDTSGYTRTVLSGAVTVSSP